MTSGPISDVSTCQAVGQRSNPALSEVALDSWKAGIPESGPLFFAGAGLGHEEFPNGPRMG